MAKDGVERLRQLKMSMPMTPDQIAEAEAIIKTLGKAALQGLGLTASPQTSLPPDLDKMQARQRLKVLQSFISSYEYNFTPEQYFNVRKDRPLGRIMDTAKKITRDALPIKCVEAVFLGLYLTCDMEDLDRIPVGFKSEVDGKVYRHIVLVIRDRKSGLFGALGLSRRAELMYKDLTFSSMSAILTDYKEAYERWWHTVLKVRVGLPVEHDYYSTRPVCWRHCCVKVPNKKWEKLCAAFDDHAAKAHRLHARWQVTGGKAKIKGEDEEGNTSGGVPAGSAMAAVRAYKSPRRKAPRPGLGKKRAKGGGRDGKAAPEVNAESAGGGGDEGAPGAGDKGEDEEEEGSADSDDSDDSDEVGVADSDASSDDDADRAGSEDTHASAPDRYPDPAGGAGVARDGDEEPPGPGDGPALEVATRVGAEGARGVVNVAEGGAEGGVVNATPGEEPSPRAVGVQVGGRTPELSWTIH